MPTETIKGSCHCMETRFSITIDQGFKPPVMLCHCTHCQRLAGGLGTYNISFPISRVKLSGRESGRYEDEGDSGVTNTKVFCTKCGSSIATLAYKRKLIIVKVPSLRDDAQKFDLTPAYEQYVLSKYAWELGKFEPTAVQWKWMKDSKEVSDPPELAVRQPGSQGNY